MNSGGELLESYFKYLIDPAQVNNGKFYFYFVIQLALMAYLGYSMFDKFRKSRLIADTPTSKFKSAHQGFIELKGRTKELNPIESPLTFTQCAWWYYKVEKQGGSISNRNWQTITEATSGNSFILFDSTGVVMIHPEKADVFPHRERTWQYAYTSRFCQGLYN